MTERGRRLKAACLPERATLLRVGRVRATPFFLPG